MEIGNLIDNFKNNIMSLISSHFDVFHHKPKETEVKQDTTIFRSRCRKENPLREFPLNDYNICEKANSIEHFPSLHGLKNIYKEIGEDTEV